MANNKIELCTWYETATTIKNNNVDRSLYHLPSNGSLRYCQQNNAADRANVCRMPATKKKINLLEIEINTILRFLFHLNTLFFVYSKPHMK